MSGVIVSDKQERERLLGERVIAARDEVFGHKAAGYRGIGIARATLDHIEEGRPGSDASYRKIEVAFGWDLGAMRRYIEGRGVLPAVPTGKPAVVVDRAHVTRDEALTLLWSATGAESDLDKIREVRRIEADLLGEVR